MTINKTFNLMKKLIYLLPFLLGLAACENSGSSAGGTLSTELDSMSYSIGAYLTEQLDAQNIKLNPNSLRQGFIDLRDEKGMDEDEFTKVLMNFSKEMSIREGLPVSEESPLAIDIDSLSAAIGADFCNRIKGGNMELNPDAFYEGAKDVLSEEGPIIEDADRQALIRNFSTMMQEKMTEKMQAEGKVNLEKGNAFLAENIAKEGVQVTGNGLQYKVLTEGKGAKPGPTDKVTVHYEGRLIDGTIFDSSYERGEPIEFGLNQVIPGWTQGLQLMNAGAKYQLYIPAQLGYGERGSPPNIGANETLVFDVELLSFKPAEE
jgi:FKBP-type peptidyl-prolyl cis-trans isomerase